MAPVPGTAQESPVLALELHYPGARLEAVSTVPDLRVVGFSEAEGGLDLVLRNDSSKRISAWAVQTTIRVPGVDRPGVTKKTVDHQLADLRAATGSRARGIDPGEVRRLRYAPSTRYLEVYDDGRRLEVTVPLVVYDDGSYAGDPHSAADLFRFRAQEYHRLADHIESLRAWLDAPETERSETTAKQRLVEAGYRSFSNEAEMDWTAAIRGELAANQAELRLRQAQIPSAHLKRSPSEGNAVKKRAVDETDRALPCNVRVGSSTIYTGCGQYAGSITVRETYNYVCEPFTSIGGTDSMTGTGDCALLGKECPPIFNTLGVTFQFEDIVWKRTVSNQMNQVGPTGWRCVQENSGFVELKCPCPGEGTQCSGLAVGTPEPDRATTCEEEEEECRLVQGCPTPIVLDIDHNGFSFGGAADAVFFDIDADGVSESITWIAAGSDDAFLVLDRDGDGNVTSGAELFGNVTPQPLSTEPNGFLALGVFDRPEEGGNGDGWITRDDAVFSSLLLWRDLSHDGRTQPGELQLLAHSDITGLSLRHQATRRRDRHGNLMRWSALIEEDRMRRMGAVDVVFQVIDGSE